MNIKTYLNLIKNMGLKYILFRISYEIMRKLGIIKRSFPVQTPVEKCIGLKEWQNQAKPFFFNSSKEIPDFTLDTDDLNELTQTFNDLEKGTLKMFSGFKTEDAFTNWHRNPENNFIFNSEQHWTEINEFATGQGDIKYIWEKGRFCFLYTIIRYDHYTKSDHSQLALSLILSWINSNRLNCGPHFKCSQEIAIRVLNWIFALYYYRNSASLNESTFNSILNSIYNQTKHIQKNLKFASIAVRNNHIISEALCLYVVGMLFPCFLESEKWKINGKKILEREGLYQIYPDGSYLQHSFNYQRVVIQLYTWALRIADVNGDRFSDSLSDRLQLAVNFLHSMQDEHSGQVPNYGANDGSLFFPLNSCSFNDYRPQLDALSFILSNESLYDKGKWNEDLHWFGIQPVSNRNSLECNENFSSYNSGGYFVLQSTEMKSIIRCASFIHRPSHSDNLHLDLWYKGSNILCDRGSFSYNTNPDILAMFLPANVHNTVSIGKYDQMLKGPRFIWYYWPKAIFHKVTENYDFLEFSGAVKAFMYLNKSGIIHHRTVKQFKETAIWEVIDRIENWDGEITQYWNIGEKFDEYGFYFLSTDGNGELLTTKDQIGFYSETYGIKRNIKQVSIKTKSNVIHTIIKKK